MMRRALPALCLVLAAWSSQATAQPLAQTDEGQIDDGQIDLSPLLGERTPPFDATDAPAVVPDDTADETADDAAQDDVQSDAADDRLPLYLRAAQDADRASPAVVRPVFYPVGGGIRRLTGEYAEIGLSVMVPVDVTVDRFVITYRNSINILDETARLTVLRDGTEIASWMPDAPGEFVSVEVPVDALSTGANRLVVRAEQSHRIFCGPEASFAIWTDIDLVQSGIEIRGDAGAAGFATFRRAAGAQVDTGGAIPVVTTLPLGLDTTRDFERRLAALGSGTPVSLRILSPYDVQDAPAALARIAVVSAADVAADITLPTVRIGADGAQILVLAEDTPAFVLDGILPVRQAVAGPERLRPGTPIRVDDLIADEIVLRTRYGRRDIAFLLPDDWMLLSSQQAHLNLQYRYPEGLPEGALLLVKVNGTTVRLLPLFGEGGVALPELPIGFPARMLRPGANAIALEAIIPGDPPDLPCPRFDEPLLEVSGESTLDVPASPSMRFERLTRALFALAPGGMSLAPDQVGNPRGEEMLTALLAGLPAVANASAATEPPTLTVGTIQSLDRVPLAALGINRSAFERALMPAPVTDIVPIASNDSFAEPVPPVVPLAQRPRIIATSTWEALRQMARPGDQSLADWIAGRHGIAMLFMPDVAAPQDIWLVVGPDANPAMVTAALAAGRLSPFGPDGQAALLTAGGVWQNWQPAKSPPQLLEPLTIENVRTVAGNFASWSPVYFVGLLAVLMSVSVLLGLSFVVRTRGARKR